MYIRYGLSMPSRQGAEVPVIEKDAGCCTRQLELLYQIQNTAVNSYLVRTTLYIHRMRTGIMCFAPLCRRLPYSSSNSSNSKTSTLPGDAHVYSSRNTCTRVLVEQLVGLTYSTESTSSCCLNVYIIRKRRHKSTRTTMVFICTS